MRQSFKYESFHLEVLWALGLNDWMSSNQMLECSATSFDGGVRISGDEKGDGTGGSGHAGAKFPGCEESVDAS